MPDRLQAIRARLAIAQHYKPHSSGDLDGQLRERLQEDVEFLLAELDNRERRIRLLADSLMVRVMFGGRRG